VADVIDARIAELVRDKDRQLANLSLEVEKANAEADLCHSKLKELPLAEVRAAQLVEQALRSSRSGLAAAFATSGTPRSVVTFLILAEESAPGLITIVGPSAPSDLGSPDARWRLVACLLDAAERVARETNSIATIGILFGSVAVTLTPCHVPPELADVALREAWDARPTLTGAPFTLATELVALSSAPLEPLQLQVKEPLNAQADDIRAVSARLRLTVFDTMAALRNAGLPLADDHVDPGVEDSLKKLLKIRTRDREMIPGNSHPTAETRRAKIPANSHPTPETRQDHPRSEMPQLLASRLLRKLLRDRRFGSHATTVDNVCSHNFRDDEKAIIKQLVTRLLRAGIIVSQGGRGKIALAPHRIDDVKQIIAGTHQDRALFDDLE
jgi:hypothetical protein